MSPERLSTLFSALADPARRAFLARLAQGEASVSDLNRLVDGSLPAVSRHVRVLSEAGLVEREKRARTTWCRLVPSALDEAESWLAATQQVWSHRLDRLEALLEEE